MKFQQQKSESFQSINYLCCGRDIKLRSTALTFQLGSFQWKCTSVVVMVSINSKWKYCKTFSISVGLISIFFQSRPTTRTILLTFY